MELEKLFVIARSERRERRNNFFGRRLVLFLAIWLLIPATILAQSQVTTSPIRIDPREIESAIGAQAYVVMDQKTGALLTIKQEDRVWPVASLTKLITASIVLDHQVPSSKLVAVKNTDNVGGARLYVNEGSTFTVDDLFYASLVASANNAANALARSTGLSKDAFVEQMNTRVRVLGLSKTVFVEPTGIDIGNMSTASEMASLARTILSRPEIKTYTATYKKLIRVANAGITKKMINTNWLVWKPQYDDVWVTAGKTGYLNESGWNLAVTVRPSKNDERELLIVLFGARSRSESFVNAEHLADWAWEVYKW